MTLPFPRDIDLKTIISDLKISQRGLELLINRTPTSESRNDLTEANIHLMEAIDVLKKQL
jgi:hypothetical protein